MQALSPPQNQTGQGCKARCALGHCSADHKVIITATLLCDCHAAGDVNGWVIIPRALAAADAGNLGWKKTRARALRSGAGDRTSAHPNFWSSVQLSANCRLAQVPSRTLLLELWGDLQACDQNPNEKPVSNLRARQIPARLCEHKVRERPTTNQHQVI